MLKAPWSIAVVAILTVLGASAASGQNPITGVWKIDLGDHKVYGIRFAVPEASTGETCGILHWLKEPKLPDGQWKLDVKNPNLALRERRILGLTLLLGRTSARQFAGRVYLPDLENSFVDLDAVSCDITIAFDGDPASARTATATIPLRGNPKCLLVRMKYRSITLVRQGEPAEGPTAPEAKCAYAE
jgi:hypothetical protein